MAPADDLLTAGLAALAGGCSLIPIDGRTKRPFFDLLPQACTLPAQFDLAGARLNSFGKPMVRPNETDPGKGVWANAMTWRADEAEVRKWIRGGAQLAIVAGAVSGGVECLDFDVVESVGACLYGAWREQVEGAAGVLQRTQGGGYQLVYRVPGLTDGNLKLAYLPDPDARHGESVAIETRGEGGYFVIAPSLGPKGQYKLLSGDWGHIPVIAQETRDAYHAAARALDESVAERKAREATPRVWTGVTLASDASVIAAYNAAHEITEALETAGYEWAGRRLYLDGAGDRERAGVVILADKSYHHDSDDPLSDGHTHSAFDVWCHFTHAGDVGAAVKAAAEALDLEYAPHGRPLADAEGHACCPVHGLRLRPGKTSGMFCPSPDPSAPRGWCTYYWRHGKDSAPLATLPQAAAPAPPAGDAGGTGGNETNGYANGVARGPDLLSTKLRSEFAQLGYVFRLNLLDDTLEVNGAPMTDITRARLRVALRDRGWKGLGAAEDVWTAEAERLAFHPIRDYLAGLVWDRTPRLETLLACLHSSDPPVCYPDGRAAPLHAVYLRKWMIGAVGKVLDRVQNLMLVLAGDQGIGKSAFVRWLGSGLAGAHLEQPIAVGEKDADIRLMTRWIWEVSELDATTRKADVAALKDFITRETITVRRPYGRCDVQKPAVASLVGTVNDGDGFLSDPTGNRRFLVTKIVHINWGYEDLDINQVWAEVMHLYRTHRAERPWQLEPHELAAQTTANRGHEVDSPLEGWLTDHFDLNAGPEYHMTSAQIIDHLRIHYDVRLSGTPIAQAMEISRVMKRLGVVRRRLDPNSPYSYLGVRGIAAAADDRPSASYYNNH